MSMLALHHGHVGSCLPHTTQDPMSLVQEELKKVEHKIECVEAEILTAMDEITGVKAKQEEGWMGDGEAKPQGGAGAASCQFC